MHPCKRNDTILGVQRVVSFKGTVRWFQMKNTGNITLIFNDLNSQIQKKGNETEKEKMKFRAFYRTYVFPYYLCNLKITTISIYD